MRDGTLGFRSGMQKAVQLGIGLAVVANTVAIFVPLVPLPAKSEEVLSPAAQRGLVIVRTNCSRCHAVGKVGDSPSDHAGISLRSRSSGRHHRLSEIA
jgi:mono/diheme cytochrome c family protein